MLCFIYHVCICLHHIINCNNKVWRRIWILFWVNFRIHQMKKKQFHFSYFRCALLEVLVKRSCAKMNADVLNSYSDRKYEETITEKCDYRYSTDKLIFTLQWTNAYSKIKGCVCECVSNINSWATYNSAERFQFIFGHFSTSACKFSSAWLVCSAFCVPTARSPFRLIDLCIDCFYSNNKLHGICIITDVNIFEVFGYSVLCTLFSNIGRSVTVFCHSLRSVSKIFRNTWNTNIVQFPEPLKV